MKFASLENGHRDGYLVLVSKDLKRAYDLKAFAFTMQDLLENWDELIPKLEPLYEQLNKNELENSFEFKDTQAKAPLPRSYQWCDGSAFLNHGDLLEQAYNLEPRSDFKEVPVMYQGVGDTFIGAKEDVLLPSEKDGIDFEGEFAVILDDVPMGCNTEDAMSHIRLICIVNDYSLRNYLIKEIKTGFGFFQAKPSSSFSPVAVTPDELGESWKDGRVCLPLEIKWNDKWFGSANGCEMDFSFAQLISHAALTRKLAAGTIIGSGTVSNEDRRKGSSCIAEKRAIEMIDGGGIETEFMQFGDSVLMESFNENGENIFGTIHQNIYKYEGE